MAAPSALVISQRDEELAVGSPDPAAPNLGDGVTWFPNVSESVASARAHVRTVLTEWGLDEESVDDAVLMTSEVVTNVYRHTRCASAGIAITPGARAVYVTVHEPRTSEAPDGSGTALVAFTSGPEVVARAAHDQIATQSTREVVEQVVSGGFAGLVLNPAGPWAYVSAEELAAYRSV